MVERFRPGVITPLPEAEAQTAVSLLAKKKYTFLPTGCTLLDCVIAGGSGRTQGGWPQGRIVNIVGDRSTGKTLLAEEAMLLFRKTYPRAKKPRYRESEAAFDEDYYTALGGNPDDIDFGPDGPDTIWDTIESIMRDLTGILDEFDAEVAEKVKLLRKKKKKLTQKMAERQVLTDMEPGLYIIDSLDGLSSEAELARIAKRQKKAPGETEGSYNLEKQKLLGEFFRTEVRRLKKAKILVIFISQIRDRIGAMIRGKKYTRTGGKALDFYASVVIFLADLGKVYETIKGVKRPVAIKIKAKCDKNKISSPYLECFFELRFGYGTDDDWACLDFLKSVNKLGRMGLKEMPKSLKGIDLERLKIETVKVWSEIDESFKPPKGKYAA